MSQYDITALRADLAATIQALRDPVSPMAVDRAKAISEVAQTIINSAKVEVDMINALGRGRVVPSGFIGKAPPDTLERQEAQQGALEKNPIDAEPERNGYVGSPIRGPIGSLR